MAIVICLNILLKLYLRSLIFALNKLFGNTNIYDLSKIVFLTFPRTGYLLLKHPKFRHNLRNFRRAIKIQRVL